MEHQRKISCLYCSNQIFACCSKELQTCGVLPQDLSRKMTQSQSASGDRKLQSTAVLLSCWGDLVHPFLRLLPLTSPLTLRNSWLLVFSVTSKSVDLTKENSVIVIFFASPGRKWCRGTIWMRELQRIHLWVASQLPMSLSHLFDKSPIILLHQNQVS